MAVPYFCVYKDKSRAKAWRWHFKASNGETVAVSEGYHNLVDCEASIALIRKESPGATLIGDPDYKTVRSDTAGVATERMDTLRSRAGRKRP